MSIIKKMTLQMDNNFVTAQGLNEYRHLPPDMSFMHKRNSLGVLQKELRSTPPRNGSSFTTTNQAEFVVNMNQPAKFMNWRDSYVDMKITNNATSSIAFEGRVGIISLVDNLLVETDSSTRFSYVTDCAEIVAVDIAKNTDNQYLDMTGNVLYGTASDPVVGLTLAGSTPGSEHAYKCLPVGLLPSGVFKQKYWPMFGTENIRVVLDLNSAIKAVIGTDQASTDLTISDIKLWYDVYTLTPKEYNDLNADLGGVYKLYATDWVHITDTLEANSVGKTVNLGIAKKKCKRVVAMIRAQADLSAVGTASITNRAQSKVTKYYLKVDDVIIGQKEIEYKTGSLNVDNGALSYAETMKSNGGLLNVHTRNYADGFTLVEPLGTGATTVGSYFMEINLDNGFGSKNALSGLPCHSNGYFAVEKGAINETETLDIYVEYISEYVLDNNRGGIWTVLG